MRNARFRFRFVSTFVSCGVAGQQQLLHHLPDSLRFPSDILSRGRPVMMHYDPFCLLRRFRLRRAVTMQTKTPRSLLSVSFSSRAERKNAEILMFCCALDISLAAKCDKHSLAIAEPRTTEYIAFRLNERRDKSERARAQLTHRLQSVGRSGERRENAKY